MMNYKFELDCIQTLEVTATECIITGKLYGENCNIQLEFKDTKAGYLRSTLRLINKASKTNSGLRVSVNKINNNTKCLIVTNIKSEVSTKVEITDESFIVFQRRKKKVVV